MKKNQNILHDILVGGGGNGSDIIIGQNAQRQRIERKIRALEKYENFMIKLSNAAPVTGKIATAVLSLTAAGAFVALAIGGGPTAALAYTFAGAGISTGGALVLSLQGRDFFEKISRKAYFKRKELENDRCMLDKDDDIFTSYEDVTPAAKRLPAAQQYHHNPMSPAAGGPLSDKFQARIAKLEKEIEELKQPRQINVRKSGIGNGKPR